MRLERWALIAEIISGVAIVVTLIVLIFQIRDNTNAVESANRQSIAARTEAISLAAAANQQLSDLLFVRESIDPESKEANQLRSFYAAQMRAIEEIYYQSVNGRLDEDYFLRRAEVAFVIMNNRVARDWWSGARFRYDPSFVEWLEDEMFERFGE